MPFAPIESERLPAAIVRQVELLILRGVLRPGARLPPERDLAERMGVSRPSLREGLAELREAGLIESAPEGGARVAEVLGSAFSPALVRLFARHEEAVLDALAFRRDVEGLAAARAARRAGPTDHAVIRAAWEAMAPRLEGGGDGRAEADLDAAFHLAIIEASHNTVLLHMMRSIYDLLRAGVFWNRRAMFEGAATREAVHAQHRAILEAIEARDPDAARAASDAHLDYVREALRDRSRAARNEEVARQRLARS